MRRAVIASLLGLAVAACAPPPRPPEPGVLTISREQAGAWTRNFNPVLPGGGARFPTRAGVYEPLLIFNRAAGEYVPWLATDWAWGEGESVLRFTVRRGVRWSDGAPLTPADVAFTFTLLREHPVLDAGGLWTFLSSVTVSEDDPDAVEFRFKEAFSPGLDQLAHHPILPRHVWSRVDDPAVFANPDPVGTGPFTEVTVFEDTVYRVGRNPHYWQEGRPAVAELRFPAFPTNEQATLALIHGEVDWAGNFIPAVDRTFVARNPDDHGYWFPAFDSAIFLYPNNTVAPLSDPTVRRALSRAIDRELVVQVAMYGYTEPSDETGLSSGYGGFKDGEAASRATWADHDPAEAERLLDRAGFPRGEDGVRRGPDGEPLVLQLNSVTGWSDWVRAAQVIAGNLESVGVGVRVRGYDFGAWFDRLQRGDFELSMGWAVDGPTPYGYYRTMMAASTAKPVGETSTLNWHRHASTEMDGLLEAFAKTASRPEQEALAHRMQALFVREAPAIPLFLNPSWGEFNRSRFEGWPTAENPFARLSPNHDVEPLLVLTALRPRAVRGGPVAGRDK